jgi:hypothetical protein
VLKEHPLLPTDEQCDLMDKFVQAMDLDEFVASVQIKQEDREDDDMEP